MPNFEALGFIVTAFVLVELNTTSSQQIDRKNLGITMLKKFPARIREVHAVTGDFDLMLKLRAKSLPELGDIVEQLQQYFPISRTRTFVAYRSSVEELTHPFILEELEVLKRPRPPEVL